MSIPSSWCTATLSELGSIETGNTPPKSDPENYGHAYPWVKPPDLDQSEPITSTTEYLSESGARKARLLPEGAVLVSCIGTLGKVGIAGRRLATNQQINSIVFDGRVVESRYGYYFCQTLAPWLEENASATTIAIVNKGKFSSAPFLLAPKAEQRRIVEKLDALTSDVDFAVTALKRVQANLRRYRASVLKAACEGRLVPTEAELARKDGRTHETGEQLLARILKERRGKWEADQLAKMLAAGKLPKNDDWKKKYKEPATPNVANLPRLPEGWAWATVEQLNAAERPCAYGVLQPGPDLDEGISFVRVGDIDDGYIAEDGLKRIAPEIAMAYPRTKLQGGEVLITLVGAVGRTALVPMSLVGANVARAVGVLSIPPGSARPRWVELWFRNPAKVVEMTGKAHEVARMTLNLEDVRAAVVAVPPSEEQDRIIAEAEAKLSTVKVVFATIDAHFIKADRLRQSILKRAFEGKIIQQDPSDEPASVLLERIRAERDNQKPVKPRSLHKSDWKPKMRVTTGGAK